MFIVIHTPTQGIFGPFRTPYDCRLWIDADIDIHGESFRSYEVKLIDKDHAGATASEAAQQ